ncbi:MAG: hypothetical protein RLZZ546_1702 [Bacteroidota bacterium]|jgi:1,4-dihydroxy-6-naphthoate synthase
MQLNIGISPCPNDTFIFDAIYHKKIDLDGIKFNFIIEDVETLNKSALEGIPDITKLSYSAFARNTHQYQMLKSGGALGRGCGPLLLSNKKNIQLDNSCIAGIPGINTTANFLMGLAYPTITNKKEILFSDIEQWLIEEKIDLGLMIHEARFTYDKEKLSLIQDLGDYWEETTGCPIPLGGIAIKRNLSEEIKSKVDNIIKKSVLFAFENKEESKAFVKMHAQDMNDEIIKAHIDLYVNDYSIEVGELGRKGVYTLLEKMRFVGLIDGFVEPLFV